MAPIYQPVIIILFLTGFVNSYELYNNASVLIGNDVTLNCSIIPTDSEQLILWEKIYPEEQYQLLSYKSKTTNTSKYSTNIDNNLLIRDVQLRDEGFYQCENHQEKYNTSLYVSVPMEDLSLTADVQPPYPNNQPVALICRSTHSRPPADLRWYKGARKIALFPPKTHKTVTDRNGFGNSESILSVFVNRDEKDIPYRCVADLPGQMSVQTAFLFPFVISLSSKCLFDVWLFLLTTITILLLHQ